MRSLLLLCALAGCVTDESFGEIESDVLSANKLAANKLAANKLAANKLAANALSGSGLAGSTMVETADGRDVLSYIVSCALPAGASLSITTKTNTRVTFPGAIGLAPAWATRAPTVSERRWVTACVLARTNKFGVSVQMSMRGAHTALNGSLGELLGYLLVEGAFYGDLFDPAGPQMYACAAEVRDLNLALSTQELRACAVSDDGITTGCGFTYTGKCAVIDLSLAPACNSLLFPYKNCRGGRTSSAPIFTEVITVSLATSLL